MASAKGTGEAITMVLPKASTDTRDASSSSADASRREILAITQITMCIAVLGMLFALTVTIGVDILLVVALLVAGYFIGVAIHELGHFVAGMLAGFQFVTLAVGPLKVDSSPQGPRLGLRRPVSPFAMLGGLYQGVPKVSDKLARRICLMASGGPVASLLLLALVVVLWWRLSSGLAGTALLLFACLWAIITAFDFIPATHGKFNSDGLLILHSLRHPAEITRMYALRQLFILSGMQQRPRDWGANWIAIVVEPCGNADHEALANYLAYYWSWDRGELGQAGAYLDRALDVSAELHPALRHDLQVDAAFYHASFAKSPSVARDFLQEALTIAAQEGFCAENHLGTATEKERLRAEAAILLAEGKVEEAREKGRAWLAFEDAPKSVVNGIRIVEREWIEQLLQESEAQSPGTHPDRPAKNQTLEGDNEGA